MAFKRYLAVLLLPVLSLLASPAAAEWVAAEGEYLFGPETAEAEACRLATARAKESALAKVLGERLAGEEMLVCTEQGVDAECQLHRTTWNMVDGDIRSLRNVATQTRQTAEAAVRRCVTSLEADVARQAGQPDPSFDVGVRLNRSLFRDGEEIRLELDAQQPMHLAIFQWLPYEAGDAQVSRLFPNAFDDRTLIKGAGGLPAPDRLERYRLAVRFPKDGVGTRRLADEYLLVVGTRARVAFREQYTLDEFRARLLEIPADQRRLVRRAYSVMRPGS